VKNAIVVYVVYSISLRRFPRQFINTDVLSIIFPRDNNVPLSLSLSLGECSIRIRDNMI